MVTGAGTGGASTVVRFGGERAVVGVDGRTVWVETGGARCDPTAAHLLTALGAEPPPWLNVAEAIQAGRAELPDDVLALLLGSRLAEVRETLVERPDLNADAVARLAVDGSGAVRSAIASGAHTLDEETAAALAADEWVPVRRGLAHRRGALPAATASILAHDPDDLVRRWLAERADLPAAAADVLAHDPDDVVRRKLALRVAPPAAAADVLADDPGAD